MQQCKCLINLSDYSSAEELDLKVKPQAANSGVPYADQCAQPRIKVCLPPARFTPLHFQRIKATWN